MKAYKGFDKNMQCRGFQYEEGKEYTTDRAELCRSGFHACENPLDCFGYYSPAESVFHEVDLDATDEKESSDSKRVGNRIKIGARLDVAGICKAHFEYVKEHTVCEERRKDGANLSAQDWSSLAARDGSSLAARNSSSLAAQDWSSLAAQDLSSLAARDGSSLAARDRSSLAARDGSSLAARDGSSLAARDGSSLAAQDWSSLAARDGSSLAARNRSSLAARNSSSLAARNRSSLAAQDSSSLAAQDRSSLSGGKDCVVAAFNSKARAGIGSLIALATRDWIDGAYKITGCKAGVVDGVNLMPDTWYTLKDGEFVEVGDDD